MHRTFIVLLTFVVVSLSVASATNPQFLPPALYPSGGPPHTFVVVDVNHDGIADVVVADGNGGFDVLLGNAKGTFPNAVFHSAGACCASSLAARDINGDGNVDVVVALWYGNQVVVFLGNGNGTFQPPVAYDASGSGGGLYPSAVALADFNGDSKPDIVVTHWAGTNALSKTINVLLNNGDGTFGPALSYSSGGQIGEAVAVADVNGDGKIDILVANFVSSYQTWEHGSVTVLLGNGDGTFQSATAYSSGGYGATGLAVGDINHDGKPDIVVTDCEFNPEDVCSNAGAGPGLVGVMLGNGDGTFQPVVTYDLGGGGGGAVAIADMDGDDNPDILVASCGSMLCKNKVALLPGNGDGTFQQAALYTTGGTGAAYVGSADVNQDSAPDILVATCKDLGCSSGAIAVLLNSKYIDTIPPVISMQTSPKYLWSADGQMVPVAVWGKITDSGSGVSGGSLVYSVVDEYQQFEPSNHFSIDAAGNYSFVIQMPASVAVGDTDGLRHYGIVVTAQDNAGNRSAQWRFAIATRNRP